MGDVIYTDFKSKNRQYTKGGGFDDLTLLAVEIMNRVDTAPCELPSVWPDFYHAPDKDPA